MSKVVKKQELIFAPCSLPQQRFLESCSGYGGDDFEMASFSLYGGELRASI